MPTDRRTRQDIARDEAEAKEIEATAHILASWAHAHAEDAIPMRSFRHMSELLAALAVGVRKGHIHEAGPTREVLREVTRSIRRGDLPPIRLRSSGSG